MRIAILSDIHGNRHALDAVLDEVERSDVEEIWCLGDVVGYGADPIACIELVREHASVCLAGNHDLGVCGELPLEQFSRSAALAARWTEGVLGVEDLAFLRNLSPVNVDEIVGLFHASPRDPVWEYVLSPLQAELCLDAQQHRVCLIGHSHVALTFVREEGTAATGQTRSDGDLVELGEGEWMLNPGSVGQPRDGDPRAAWLELDTVQWTALFRRAEYDIEAAAAAVRAAKLPGSLADRLFQGQ